MRQFPVTPRQIRRAFCDAAEHPPNAAFREVLEGQRQEGLSWRWEGLGDWSTEAIFERLRTLGAQKTETSFVVQAAEAGSCEQLVEVWQRGIPRPVGFWADFPPIAAEELWKRLTPELPCPELVADQIDAALAAGSSVSRVWPDDAPAEIEAVLALARLLEASPAEERGARFEAVGRCSGSDLENWLRSSACGLADRFPREMIRVMCALEPVFPAEDPIHVDVAEGLARAGHGTEALAAVRQVRPENAWEYRHVAGVYLLLQRQEEALKHFAQALQSAYDASEWGQLGECIRLDLAEIGATKLWSELELRSPRPVEPERAPANVARPVIHSAATMSRKPGRNQPCPCGSGLKYKKCCVKNER